MQKVSNQLWIHLYNNDSLYISSTIHLIDRPWTNTYNDEQAVAWLECLLNG